MEIGVFQMNIFTKLFTKKSKNNKPAKEPEIPSDLSEILEDLKRKDNISDILKMLEENKPKITDLIVIYKAGEGDYDYGYQMTEHSDNKLLLWLLENTKMEFMRGDD
jgi:hypothetical protein